MSLSISRGPLRSKGNTVMFALLPGVVALMLRSIAPLSQASELDVLFPLSRIAARVASVDLSYHPRSLLSFTKCD